MTIERRMQGSVAIVRVTGRLDARTATEFEIECNACLREGAVHMVFDVEDLEYVSSMGLRVVLMIAKSLQSKGGGLKLCGLKGLVKEVFDLTRMTPLFGVYESTVEALESL